jgi:hypothetical protein
VAVCGPEPVPLYHPCHPSHRVLRFLASLDDSAAAGRSLNPLLVHRIFECVNALADELTVDGVLARTAEALYTVNTRLRSLEGLRGQVLYALAEPLTKEDSGLVHTHFARFRTNHIVWLGADGLAAEKRSFLPVPSFPTPAEDPVLPLILGGSCTGGRSGHPAPYLFRHDHRDVTLTAAAALGLLRASPTVPNWFGYTDPPLDREGEWLERVAVLAALSASRAHGVSGLPLRDFLLYFAAELQCEVPTLPLEWDDPAELQNWCEQSNLHIPALVCLRQGEVYPRDVVTRLGAVRRPGSEEESGCVVVDSDNALVFTLDWTSRNPSTSLSTEVPPECRAAYDAKRFHKLEAQVGIAVVSTLASVRTVVADDADTQVLKVTVAGDRVSIEPVDCVRTEATADSFESARWPLEPAGKKRVLVLYECDETRIRHALGTGELRGLFQRLVSAYQRQSYFT